MNQPETKGQQPPVTCAAGPQIFRGDIDDRERDADFNELRQEADDLQNGQGERERVGNRESRDDFEQVDKSLYEQQCQQKGDVIITQEDVFDAEFEILRHLRKDRRGIACVVQVIRLETSKDDFLFMTVAGKRAKDGVHAPQLLEEIKRDGHILRLAKNRIAERERDQTLSIIAPGNAGLLFVGPGRQLGLSKFRLALIQLEIDMIAQKFLNGRGRGCEFAA